jgi:hypothetical protein
LFWQNGRAAVADTKFIQSKSGINEELVVWYFSAYFE